MVCTHDCAAAHESMIVRRMLALEARLEVAAVGGGESTLAAGTP